MKLIKNFFVSVFLMGVLLTACSGSNQNDQVNAPNQQEGQSNDFNAEAAVQATEPDQETNGEFEVSYEGVDLLDPGQLPPSRAANEFSTDFSIHTVDYTDILSGGPPKDGIPAVDNPQFVTVSAANGWLQENEAVVLLMHNDQVRIYPIQILMWHEIVNDVVGGDPVSITYCPLCNTAIAFSGLIDGESLDFGTTGRLRYSNLIMYDRQTETWWQQATGEAIAGLLTGRQLDFLPATLVAWEDIVEEYPDAMVLSRETGYSRNYGSNPYVGYDRSPTPFLYRGPLIPSQIPAIARVITLDINGEAVAYPYGMLTVEKVVNDLVGGQEVVIIWQAGVASALDSSLVATGEDVGTAASYSREVNGENLTFSFQGEQIVDDQTGSVWNIFGQATSGELTGTQLEPVVSVNHFWFSWAAFRPETRIYTP